MDGKHRKTFRKHRGVDCVPPTRRRRHESYFLSLPLLLFLSPPLSFSLRGVGECSIERARPNGISLRGQNMVGTKDERVRKAASDPRREIRIGKRAWSRLAGIFRFRRGYPFGGRDERAVCQIGRGGSSAGGAGVSENMLQLHST